MIGKMINVYSTRVPMVGKQSKVDMSLKSLLSWNTFVITLQRKPAKICAIYPSQIAFGNEFKPL
jgi:hypothetical protein